MKMKKIFPLGFLFFFMMISCDSNYGDVVVRDGVQVFYTSPEIKKHAETLADFWVEHHLTTNQTQYLQLSDAQVSYQLKLIPNDSTLLDEIPFDTQLVLSQLDSLLNHALAFDKEVELYLSDKLFSRTKRVF
jgi:hypothetical protein